MEVFLFTDETTHSDWILKHQDVFLYTLRSGGPLSRFFPDAAERIKQKKVHQVFIIQYQIYDVHTREGKKKEMRDILLVKCSFSLHSRFHAHVGWVGSSLILQRCHVFSAE